MAAAFGRDAAWCPTLVVRRPPEVWLAGCNNVRHQDAAGSPLQEADVRSLQAKESPSIISASKGEPANMIEPEQLSDEELAREAFEWRRRALSGDQDARGIAHELERELRRRSGALSTLGAALKEPPVRRKPWWRFWV